MPLHPVRPSRLWKWDAECRGTLLGEVRERACTRGHSDPPFPSLWDGARVRAIFLIIRPATPAFRRFSQALQGSLGYI